MDFSCSQQKKRKKNASVVCGEGRDGRAGAESSLFILVA